MKSPREQCIGDSERNMGTGIQSPGLQIVTTDSSGADDDSLLFISPGRKSSFESSYCRRKIVNGIRAVWSDFEGSAIRSKIEAIGWTPIITMDVPVFPRLVRLFYCNLEFNRDEPSITSLVNGTRIHLDCESLSAILGIPNEGTKYYKTKTWETDDCQLLEAIRFVCENDKILSSSRPSAMSMPVQSRLLHKMARHLFLPKGRPRDQVSKMELFLLKKILSCERVNLCYIIIHYMIDSVLNKNIDSYLPYGMLLTKVFSACKVAISPDEEFETLSRKEVYTMARFCRMGFSRKGEGWRLGKRKRDTDEEREEDKEEGEENEAIMDETLGDLSSDGQQKSSSCACENDSIHESLRKLTARVDSLENSVQSIQLQQEQGFANLNAKLDKLMEFLNHHFWPYPPPPAAFDG